MQVNLTKKQREKLENLWFVYGNNGRKHTIAGHKFIQGFLEHGEDLRKFYNPPIALIKEVDKLMMG